MLRLELLVGPDGKYNLKKMRWFDSGQVSHSYHGIVVGVVVGSV